MLRAPSPRSLSRNARSSRPCSSSGDSGCSTTTRARLSSAALISKLGASVVAPTSVTVPSSTIGSSASCCAAFMRWISSTNSSVRAPLASNRWRACSAITRNRGTPSLTALNGSKVQPMRCAMRRPSVVLPVPGGPQRIMEPSTPRSTASYTGVPGVKSCRWPTYSSSVRGRNRCASGAVLTTSLNSPGAEPAALPLRRAIRPAASRASAPACPRRR